MTKSVKRTKTVRFNPDVLAAPGEQVLSIRVSRDLKDLLHLTEIDIAFKVRKFLAREILKEVSAR